MENLAIPTDKFIIGLTGNIATGKSAVMQLAAQRGAYSIDADKVVHEILNTDAGVQQAIAGVFGPAVHLEDGRIDRPALAKIVFNDAQALRQLESIVHPAVYTAVLKRITETGKTIIIYEAIKLLESKFRDKCHQIWVTTCSPERQLERLQSYRGLDKETALARIKAQAPQAEKIAQADIVIDTNGSMAETEAQFAQAWSQLRKAI
jgi:dephospho-CoA kinase